MHNKVLFTLTASLIALNGNAQRCLPENLVADSLIRKLGIKMVTETLLAADPAQAPHNITVESYDRAGLRISRDHLNPKHHRFVSTYSYPPGNRFVLEKQVYYDWNPYRDRRPGDTTLKHSSVKYVLATRCVAGRNARRQESAGALELVDDRLRVRLKPTKSGQHRIEYTYAEAGQLAERRHYQIRAGSSSLSAIDSLYADGAGRVRKEVSYRDGRNGASGSATVFGTIVQTLYEYNEKGLLSRKLVTTRYPNINRASPVSEWTFEYEFY